MHALLRTISQQKPSFIHSKDMIATPKFARVCHTTMNTHISIVAVLVELRPVTER